MADAIRNIIDLSNKDQILFDIRRSLREIEHKLGEYHKDIDLITGHYDDCEKLFKELEAKSRAFKSKLEEEESEIAKMESKIPLIRTQKEFIAGKKQVEDARKRRGKIEDELLDVDIRKEDCENELKELKEKLKESRLDFDKKSEDLLNDKGNLEKQLKEFEIKHKELEESLEPTLKRFYQNCISRGITPPISPVEDGSCGGCHLALLPQMVNELRTNPNSYQHCPNCYRLVYYPTKEETNEMKAVEEGYG